MYFPWGKSVSEWASRVQKIAVSSGLVWGGGGGGLFFTGLSLSGLCHAKRAHIQCTPERDTRGQLLGAPWSGRLSNSHLENTLSV